MASATAEACLLAARATKRKAVALLEPIHPATADVVATYARGAGLRVDMLRSRDAATPEHACLVVQQPDFLGAIVDLEPLAEALAADGVLLVAVADPFALGLLRAPGDAGADIVTGEGRDLAGPPHFGGPSLGLFAARAVFLRQMPGRIVGRTRELHAPPDGDGEPRTGYVLTLQAREQFIRRERATSNVSTAQSLIALAFTVTVQALGPRGLREAAELSYQRAHDAARRIAALDGYEDAGARAVVLGVSRARPAARRRARRRAGGAGHRSRPRRVGETGARSVRGPALRGDRGHARRARGRADRGAGGDRGRGVSAPRPGGGDVGARLSFDRGVPGRRAVDVPRWRGEVTPLPDAGLLRDSVRLPELSQGELVRYYTELSTRNYGIDSGTYPLGSCTMKYNPKVDDLVASLPGLADAHPQAPPTDVQGTLRTLVELRDGLGEITGLGAVSLAPAAGAQGELAGVLMITRALEDRGELAQRRRILVPDSAHGTNPATAAMAGFTVTQIPTAADGSLDRAAIERELDGSVAAVMVTVPNTLGLWERGIEEVSGLIHDAGAYLYGDGANLNAIMGRVRYGDLGFDVVHLNLHKSFSTPHGGGGPGAGPVCCSEELARYLPTPVVTECDDGVVRLVEPERSIGRLQQFGGNVGVLIRAYAYMRALGLDGLRAGLGPGRAQRQLPARAAR